MVHGTVGAEFRVTSVKSPILSTRKLVTEGYQIDAGPNPVQNVQRRQQRDAGRGKEFSRGGRLCLHDS